MRYRRTMRSAISLRCIESSGIFGVVHSLIPVKSSTYFLCLSRAPRPGAMGWLEIARLRDSGTMPDEYGDGI